MTLHVAIPHMVYLEFSIKRYYQQVVTQRCNASFCRAQSELPINMRHQSMATRMPRRHALRSRKASNQ